MNPILEAVTTVLIAIVGVAIIALIISPRARTSQVIQATASGFSNSLAVAMTPVTGEDVKIDTSYPNNNRFGGFDDYSFGSFQ